MNPRGILLRHASTDWNEMRLWQGGEVDRPLSEAGRSAASAVGQHLKQLWDVRPEVVTSPLARAVQTAYLLAGDGPFEINSDLREMNAGSLAGMRMEEIENKWPEFGKSWSSGHFVAPPGGETRGSVLNRARRTIKDLTRRTSPWIAVSHLGLLRAVDEVLGLAGVDQTVNLAGISLEADGWRPWVPPRLPKTPRLRVAIGTDARGEPLRARILEWAAIRSIDIVEPIDEKTNPDYPDVAFAVARAVADGVADRGILSCGTGLGMAIAANKVRGIRAAAVSNSQEARGAAGSNDANILCLGAQIVSPEVALELLDTWIETPFNHARSGRKVGRIIEIEGHVL